MTLRLNNRLFISTRPKDSSEELTDLLSREGATVIEFPLIEIKAAQISENEKQNFAHPFPFQWIIFTSPNGVKFFFAILQEQTGSHSLPDEVRFAVIGEKTESVLNDFGYTASFINPGSTAEDFSQPFLNHINGGNTKPDILLPLGNLARTTIQDHLEGTAKCTRINVYTTEIPESLDRSIVQIIEDDRYDMLIFTSPSGIQNFLKAFPSLGMKNIPMACIGPVTSREAINSGFRPLVTAPKSSAKGIAESIINYYISKT